MIRHYAREGFPTEPSDIDFDEAVQEVTGLVVPPHTGQARRRRR